MPGTTAKSGFHYPLSTEAPDGPGAVLSLANDLENVFNRHATWQLNGARNITPGGWNTVPMDTVLSDPSASMCVNSQDLYLPWDGRYEVKARVAVGGGDIGTSANCGMQIISANNGAVLSETGQYGMRDSWALQIMDEITRVGGTVQQLRLLFYVPSTITGRQFSYGADGYRCRFSARWIGPT